MVATTVEQNINIVIRKFYMESLESLQIRNLDDKYEEFLLFYRSVREKIQRQTKYRTLRKLGPILLYFFLKIRGILLVLPEFLDLNQLDYGAFIIDLKSVVRFYPEFKARDRKFITKEYIATILKSLNINKKLTSKALKIFTHFYSLIQNTKEEVIAAVICTLTTISFDLYGVSLKSICEKAGIRQSGLNRCFLKKIFPYLGIPDKTKLKTSFDEIKDKIREKLPLLGIEKKALEDSIHLTKENLNTKYIYVPLNDHERNMSTGNKRIVKTEWQIQNRPISPQLANYYLTYQPVVRLFNSLLEKTKLKEVNNKAPLDKLSSLMLNHKEEVKKNIAKTCEYLLNMNKFRVEKTILGLVLVLSFPQVTQVDVSSLVGVSPMTLRNNLAIRNIKANFGHVIGVQINIDLIFEYLEKVINAIKKKKVPQVESRVLKGVIIKVPQIKTIIPKIVSILRENQLYKKEPLILAMAIYLSSPFASRVDMSEIIYCSLKKKVSFTQIENFQKEIFLHKMFEEK